MKASTRTINYHFIDFQRTIDRLPSSQIRATTGHYRETIVWELSAGTVDPDVEIQRILNFWEFLDSNLIPAGVSKRELGFYRRIAKRLIRNGFMPEGVMDQFEKPDRKNHHQPQVDHEAILCGAI